jgi:hypothetical protein
MSLIKSSAPIATPIILGHPERISYAFQTPVAVSRIGIIVILALGKPWAFSVSFILLSSVAISRAVSTFGFDFRNPNTIGLSREYRFKILLAILCLGGIDPHSLLNVTEIDTVEGFPNDIPGSSFLLWGNSIFQVQYEAIRVILLAFFYQFSPVPRDIQQASPWSIQNGYRGILCGSHVSLSSEV